MNFSPQRWPLRVRACPEITPFGVILDNEAAMAPKRKIHGHIRHHFPLL